MEGIHIVAFGRHRFGLQSQLNRLALRVIRCYDAELQVSVISFDKLDDHFDFFFVLRSSRVSPHAVLRRIEIDTYNPAGLVGFFGTDGNVYELQAIQSFDVVPRLELLVICDLGDEVPDRNRHAVWSKLTGVSQTPEGIKVRSSLTLRVQEHRRILDVLDIVDAVQSDDLLPLVGRH